MKLTVKQVRDIYGVLNFLALEPIVTHLLNFRIKTAIQQLKPTMDSLQKSELAIVAAHAEQADGKQVTDSNGQPKWKTPEDEMKATQAFKEILDSEIEIPGLRKLSWDMLENAKCSYLNKEINTRTTESLVIPASLLIALDPLLEGEPVATA